MLLSRNFPNLLLPLAHDGTNRTQLEDMLVIIEAKKGEGCVLRAFVDAFISCGYARKDLGKLNRDIFGIITDSYIERPSNLPHTQHKSKPPMSISHGTTNI
jgi:hypothetical protein